MTQRRCGRRTVPTTNESRILFPKSRITKGELIDYYQSIASHMLPYMRDRLVTMHRFPEGINGEGFYQKNASAYFPSWIRTKRVRKEEGGVVSYVICNDEATLVYLANQACITPHLWLSRVDKLDYPDRMIFDLDPSSGKSFASVLKLAGELKVILEDIGLTPYAMLTGSRGVHVVVPLKRTNSFDVVRAFARDVGQLVVEKYPKIATMEARKSKRRGRVFIDVLRNAYGQTAVAPYAVRAHEGAPVATPVTWRELLQGRITSQQYTIKTIGRRLARINDPWHAMKQHASTLRGPRKRLDAQYT